MLKITNCHAIFFTVTPAQAGVHGFRPAPE